MFVVYDFQTKVLKVYSAPGKLEDRRTIKSEKQLENLPLLYRAGLVCQGIRKGRALGEVANGQSWRPTVDEFLEWVLTDDQVKDLYDSSCKLRYAFLKEKIYRISKASPKTPEKILKRDKKLADLKESLKLLEKDKKAGEEQVPIIEVTNWE